MALHRSSSVVPTISKCLYYLALAILGITLCAEGTAAPSSQSLYFKPLAPHVLVTTPLCRCAHYCAGEEFARPGRHASASGRTST
ncbi:hypothetical protein BJV74DRAFT_210510 [Russula compacta]|nr:hypothetical protein BJV74DRAFT_210510 [Russula compacta]